MGSLQSIQQSILLALKRKFASGADEDVTPGMIVQYVGSEDSGKIQVTSVGDLVFIHGDVGTETADTTIIATVPGTINVDTDGSAPATAKEVEDIINGSINWRARMTGLLPDDDMDVDTGFLVTRASTQAKVAAGVPLYIDGTKPKLMSWSITGVQFDNLNVEDGRSNYNGLRTDEVCDNWLDYVEILNTFGSNSSVFKVYECAHGESSGTLLFTADALTTATKQTHGATTPQDAFIKSSRGKRLVCRVENTTVALTINEFIVQGRVVDYGQQPRAT